MSMTEEHVQAISFANSYFALADGLAFGLENHLAEDVLLDWFGRTIKGRRNVAMFLQAHKVTSRHVFPDIVPTTGIGYKKRNANRKKVHSYEGQTRTDDRSEDAEQGFVSKVAKVEKDENENELEPREICAVDQMTTYDLSEGDLSNLFKLEITASIVEEIERSINRVKLEEEMAPTIKAIKRERGQGDGPVLVESSTLKYVEAHGEIEFSRKIWKRDSWDAYASVVSNVSAWRRSCKLQIAYSVSDLPESKSKRSRRARKRSRSRFSQANSGLPSLEEINEISSRLVPNTGDLDKFFKPVDFFNDRNDVLEALELEMISKDPGLALLSPQYVKNRLVYDKPSVGKIDSENEETGRKFLFNYRIHLIIYEGTNKCKTNLLREFEKLNVQGEE